MTQAANMRQAIFIIRCLLLFGILTASDVAAQSQPQRRPNILFIFSDDHAVQAIGAYGSKINQTPHIDRLARAGAVFRNSFCANSLCGPSRACILTGKHSHLNGFLRNGDRFNSQQTTFPPLLQHAGYQTAVVGKWHLETQPVGFDYWEILPGQGSYYNPDFIQMDGSRQRHQGYATDVITDLSLQWLKQRRDRDRPFLLMCQHKAPHRNWTPPPRHFGLFDHQPVAEPATLRDDYAGRSELLKANEMTVRDHMYWAHDMKFHGENRFPEMFVDGYANNEYERMSPAQREAWDAYYEPRNAAFIEQMSAGQLSADEVLKWKYQRYVTDYLKCVQAVDDGVGRLLDYLDEAGLSDNTIVIYCSDQGFYLGEHGWYDKRWMFEESLRMPFVIRWPGKIQPGTTSDALIQNIDYAPTLLDVAGVEVPQPMQGRSLVPVFENHGRPTPDWRDAVYYAYYENAAVHAVPVHDGIRTDRYKLMYFPRSREWQLFDLQSDPQELRSRHADPEYANILDGMQRRYHDVRTFYKINTAVIPATRADEDWWRDRLESTTAQARRDNPKLVFVGDSITQAWEDAGRETWQEFYADRQPLNLGFSGDRTEHVIWRLNQLGRPAFAPNVAVLMIGTNNTGHLMQAPQEVAAGVRRILSLLEEKSPATKVLLLGVFPRGQHPLDADRLNNVAINQYIRRFADDRRVFYQDVGEVFLDAQGEISTVIMPDHLHLSPRGYRLWAQVIEPTLVKLGI